MDDSQNDRLDPTNAQLDNPHTTELLAARDQAGLSSSVNPEQIRPLLAAVQNPAAWSTEPEMLDALLGELAAADDQHAWASAHTAHISRLHSRTVRNLMFAVDSWTPEAHAVLKEMEPVWQIARWMALPNEEREAAPRPRLKRLPAEGTQAIFALRLDLATAADRAPTLQEVGEQVGVSREWIRQVLVRCDELMKPYRPTIERFRRWLRSTGLLLPLQITGLPNEPRLHWAVATLVDQLGINIDPVHRTISGYTKEDVERFLADLVSKARQGRFASPLVDPAELKVWLYQWHARRAWSQLGLEMVVSRIFEDYLDPVRDYLIWRGTTRSQQLEFLLSQYPQGFALHKESDTLATMIDYLFGEQGLIGHSLATQASGSPLIHLWGHGIHIHQRFIPPASPLLDEIVDWMEDRLTSDFEEVSILSAWDVFATRCDAAGIPTPAALYTWLRLNASNRVNTPRYPTVLPAGNSQRVSRTVVLREYLRAEGPVPFEPLAAHLSATRAWSTPTTLNTMQNMPDLYRGDDDWFRLTEWLPGRHRVVDLLMPEVKASLSHAPLFSILTLYRRYREVLQREEIPGPRSLWGVLREGLRHAYRFGSYPMITHLASVGEATVGAAIVSAVKSHGAPITRPLVEEILARDYGLQARAISLPAITDQIILYKGHPANQYIHRNWLEWNDAKQQQLTDRVTAVLSDLQTADPPIGYIEGLLLSPEGLPPLGYDLAWTRELLIEFLRPREDILLLGTRRRLMVPTENALGIETDLDLAGYILAQQFCRQAAFPAWEQALIRLDFCKQFPTGYLQDPAAPFVITGDEVRLRPEGQRWLLPAPRILVWQGSATVPVAAVNPELVGTPEVDELLASLFGED